MRGTESDRHVYYWLRVGIGASALAFAISTYFAITDQQGRATIVCLLEKWQTLIAGGLALFGAYLTVIGLERQLAQQRKHEEDNRWRKQYAARAGLPAALTQIIRYARVSMEVLRSLELPTTGNRILYPRDWVRPAAPLIPAAALATIQTCIESADLQNMPKLAWVLEEVQILNSRLDSLLEDISHGSSVIVTVNYLAEVIVDHLEFDIRCSKMFNYARRRSSEIDDTVTADEVRIRASTAGFELVDFPSMNSLVQRRYEAAT